MCDFQDQAIWVWFDVDYNLYLRISLIQSDVQWLVTSIMAYTVLESDYAYYYA